MRTSFTKQMISIMKTTKCYWEKYTCTHTCRDVAELQGSLGDWRLHAWFALVKMDPALVTESWASSEWRLGAKAARISEVSDILDLLWCCFHRNNPWVLQKVHAKWGLKTLLGCKVVPISAYWGISETLLKCHSWISKQIHTNIKLISFIRTF